MANLCTHVYKSVNVIIIVILQPSEKTGTHGNALGKRDDETDHVASVNDTGPANYGVGGCTKVSYRSKILLTEDKIKFRHDRCSNNLGEIYLPMSRLKASSI